MGLAGQEQDRDLKRLFEAGRYQDVVTTVAAMRSSAPGEIYLAGQAYRRLDMEVEARARYSEFAARNDEDPWKHIGTSAVMLADGNLDGAFAAATRAKTIASSLPEAHYQLGLVYGYGLDYASAAAAFEQAASLDPTFAYALYHAGLSHYRVKRIDRMAQSFETFLRLAPEALERGQVESIMRTIRGR